MLLERTGVRTSLVLEVQPHASYLPLEILQCHCRTTNVGCYSSKIVTSSAYRVEKAFNTTSRDSILTLAISFPKFLLFDYISGPDSRRCWGKKPHSVLSYSKNSGVQLKRRSTMYPLQILDFPWIRPRMRHHIQSAHKLHSR